MDLLIAEARENPHRQYIFLTPLGLDQDRDQDDLKVLRYCTLFLKINHLTMPYRPTLLNFCFIYLTYDIILFRMDNPKRFEEQDS